MNYYKLINGKNFVGVVSQLDFRTYQHKHNVLLSCDESKAQYVQFGDIYYRADWMLPVTTNKIGYETIKVIQIDEPAIREGLPLKRADWDAYLKWAGEAFRLSSMGCQDDTQIHTHMCYSEFNDILPAIAALDADVITIETSRSDMELLTAFGDFKYPNDIGPGVYDIHSPRVPTAEEIEHLLRKALQVVPKERLWVNPDCGLKTRGWPETIAALKVMVDVTKKLRAELA